MLARRVHVVKWLISAHVYMAAPPEAGRTPGELPRYSGSISRPVPVSRMVMSAYRSAR